jgi:hypothetical protein
MGRRVGEFTLSMTQVQAQVDIRKKAEWLLACGYGAAAVNVIQNIVTVALHPNYDWLSQTVSELSAVDAPTRPLWLVLSIPYGILMFLFGLGIWRIAKGRNLLRIAAGAILLEMVIGAFWPPMHEREVIAAGGGTLTDTLHIVFTAIWGVLMFVAIICAGIDGRGWFRWFSVVCLLVMIVFGIFTSGLAPAMTQNQPTPMMGVWERINIAAYLIWLAVLSAYLIGRNRRST